MGKTVLFFTLATITLAGCGGNGGGLHRDQKQYEVVQEGAASGGTTTALNPEAAQPPMAMTGTNADTTSAFTLPSAVPPAPGAATAPGTIAGTLRQPDSSYGYRPAPAAPAAPRPHVVERAPAPPPPVAAEPAEPAPAPEPPAPATENEEQDEEAKEPEAPAPAPTSTQPPTN